MLCEAFSRVLDIQAALETHTAAHGGPHYYASTNASPHCTAEHAWNAPAVW